MNMSHVFSKAQFDNRLLLNTKISRLVMEAIASGSFSDNRLVRISIFQSFIQSVNASGILPDKSFVAMCKIEHSTTELRSGVEPRKWFFFRTKLLIEVIIYVKHSLTVKPTTMAEPRSISQRNILLNLGQHGSRSRVAQLSVHMD